MSNGHWNGGPKAWADPEAALKQQEFWTIYETCQNNLPPKMAKVFMLRELVGLEADEVCRKPDLAKLITGSPCTGRDSGCGNAWKSVGSIIQKGETPCVVVEIFPPWFPRGWIKN